MLKILIIDDDALTRKGLRMLMPWTAHQMEVVGEAANGQEALDFLKTNSVDLALTDLDMPFMNGSTFIKEASQLYPDLNYVVLTIHTEFEYIQNILRLGAIDYIAKNQFDQENFDQILTQIQSSMSKKLSQRQNIPLQNWRNRKILYPHIYALITIDLDNDEQIFQFQELNHIAEQNNFLELFSGIWVFNAEKPDFLFPDNFTNTALLQISDVCEMTYSQLERLLRNYVKDQFFYDYQPLKQVNHKRAYELSENEYITDTDMLNRLTKEWISLNWVHENELFNKLRFDLKNCKLKFSTLYHLLLNLENVWNASYSELTGSSLSLPPSFHHWHEVEEWLIQAYEKTNLISSVSQYSNEIVQNILLAKNYVDNHFSSQLNATEVARNAHMSYGYFSICFHNIVGSSFTDYCTQVRIRQAKQYLRSSSDSIQNIAFKVGYNDEKYFSRIFKKNTGVSPSEYRHGSE